MPLRSVVDIEVNSSQFDAYNAAFSKYSEAVKKLPAGWDDVSKNVGKGAKSFSEMVAAAVALTYQQKQHVAAQKEADRLTRSQSDRWRDIAKSSKDFAGNIVTATIALTKWVGPINVLTSLLGAGVGLFGLERLASSVSGQRRSAMQLGIGYGQQSAFNLDYSRFGDSQGLLSGVSGSLYDIRSPGYVGLLSTGMSAKFLETHNAADVSVELLHRLNNQMKDVPRGMTGSWLENRHLDSVISPDTVIAYRSASQGERDAQDKAYHGDVGRLGVPEDIQLKWQNLLTSLEGAGKEIEKVFVVGLANLDKPIEDLSKSFLKLTETLVDSDAFKASIDGLTSAFNALAVIINAIDGKLDGSNVRPGGETVIFGFKVPVPRVVRKILDWDPFYTAPGPKSGGQSSNAASPFGTLDDPFHKSGYAGAVDLSAAAKAISGIEGNYGSIGPSTRSGDHGYGRYQVMGANVAAWTKKYYGKELTPQEFLADKAAQDAVFNGQFGAYAAKYGPEGASRAWFAGEGGMNNPNARDVLGTSVSGYSQQFQAGYKPSSDPYQTRAPAPYFNVYDATGGNVNITQSQGAHGF